MSGVEVIVESLEGHPSCPHGPTILFSRNISGVQRNFYACSACRDRKLCPFFIYQDEKVSEEKRKQWDIEKKQFKSGIDHRKLFITLNKIKQIRSEDRGYCRTCSQFEMKKFWDKHAEHEFIQGVSDYQIEHPSEFLVPLDDTKKEAQFLFAENSVKDLVDILKKLKFRKIVCMGTPRIHEFLTNNSPETETLLLDIDRRYHHFYGPLQFSWYNSFNNHFFLPETKQILNDFLRNEKQEGGVALILDPPFGGRVEPLAYTLQSLNQQYQKLNKTQSKLSIFWIFPYFMEPQIQNSLPDFTMLDYKVDYDNHPLFQDGPKARKLGSPVRIFTNFASREIALPPENYKRCKKCKRWVSKENKHCEKCDKCTSKDGSTYTHCDICKRCVKPSWQHCKKCDRCAQINHTCGEILFIQNCFHCKKPGHKKRECPGVDHGELQRKRKMPLANKKRKLLKTCD